MRNKLGYEKLLLEQFVEKLISSSSRERVEEREDDVEDYVVWALRGVKEVRMGKNRSSSRNGLFRRVAFNIPRLP